MEQGIRADAAVGGGNGRILITDDSGQTITIDAGNASALTNQMTRDYVFTNDPNRLTRTQSCILSTSSFAVMHQISTPLNPNAGTQRYDGAWAGKNAAARLKAYRRLFDERLYKRYTN